MAFQSGREKTGGRKKGIPNKATALRDNLEAVGFDPFEALIMIAKDPEHPDHFAANKELCQYLEAKKKSVEVASETKEEIRVIVQDYTSRANNQDYLAQK